MKKFHLYILILFSVFVMHLSGCTKRVVHDLFPIVLVTPDSREFFGCRINGEPFSPEAADSSSLGSCSYLPLYAGPTGFTLQLNGNRYEASCGFYSVGIILDSTKLIQGQTYTLGTPGTKKKYGYYTFVSGCSQTRVELFTSDADPGEFIISELDEDKQIITGTFDFKVKDANGFMYRMSDGIFDRHYRN